VASKFVLSLDGTNTGSISFLSNASKSISLKKGLSVKVVKLTAPIRRSGSASSAELMACKQGIETGGDVMGYFGVAKVICSDNAVCVAPSNGRWTGY
jgi:hypothetical protein